LKKLFEYLRNNEFFQTLRNLPDTDKIDLKQMKNNVKFNQLFRRLPEDDTDFSTDIRQPSLLKLLRAED